MNGGQKKMIGNNKSSKELSRRGRAFIAPQQRYKFNYTSTLAKEQQKARGSIKVEDEEDFLDHLPPVYKNTC